MAHATIRHDAIKQLFAEMQKSFDSNGPLRVAMDALVPDRPGEAAAAPTAIGDSDQRR
jgi:hypothetical protein